LSWLNDAAQTVQFALTATGSSKVSAVWNDLFMQYSNTWVTILGFSILVWAIIRPRAEHGDSYSTNNVKQDVLEILWKPGETDYCLYYGTNEATLHYWINVFNHSKTKKALNVQVFLEALDPPDLKCAPCILRQKNDIRRDSDHTPYKDSFELKPQHGQFLDLLVQDPGMAEFWILHTVRNYSVQVPRKAYKFTLVATTDDPKIKTHKSFELFKNGPYWQMREIPLK
jgi:hypothetical protein